MGPLSKGPLRAFDSPAASARPIGYTDRAVVIRTMTDTRPTYYEFFAGGGMARAGLGDDWQCLFANDFCEKKARAYVENWGGDHFHGGDIGAIAPSDLPGAADLAWASFPCQDLSLAGAGAGLEGRRSGAFWSFWRLIDALVRAGRGPRIIALENVVGILSSRNGEDFNQICKAFAGAGYRFGALIVDGVKFVPQSRPRVFVIAIREDLEIPEEVTARAPSPDWITTPLERAHERLPGALRARWVWWRLPAPVHDARGRKRKALRDIIERAPNSVAFDTPDLTVSLLAMMSATNRAKVETARETARQTGALQVGALYRRTRIENGDRVQRAEVRFDDIAGCLRTPSGGSSRQRILLIDKAGIRSRLISARETARLMGLTDSYILPAAYNEAYHLTGDGVVAPAVAHIRGFIFDPILRNAARRVVRAA